MKILELFMPARQSREAAFEGESMLSPGTTLTEEESVVLERAKQEQAVLDEAVLRLKTVCSKLDFTTGGMNGAIVVGAHTFQHTQFTSRLFADQESAQIMQHIPEEFFSGPVEVRLEPELREMMNPAVHLTLVQGESVVSISVPLQLCHEEVFALESLFNTYSANSDEKHQHALTKADILAVVALVEALVFSSQLEE